MQSEKLLVLALFFGLISGQNGWAKEEQPATAILLLEDKDDILGQSNVAKITDYLETLLTKDGFRIVPKNKVRQLLRAKKIESYGENFNSSTQVNFGNELAAQKLLIPRFMRMGSSCTLTITLLDLERATSEKASSSEGDCTLESVMFMTESAVKDLIHPTESGGCPSPILLIPGVMSPCKNFDKEAMQFVAEVIHSSGCQVMIGTEDQRERTLGYQTIEVSACVLDCRKVSHIEAMSCSVYLSLFERKKNGGHSTYQRPIAFTEKSVRSVAVLKEDAIRSAYKEATEKISDTLLNWLAGRKN